MKTESLAKLAKLYTSGRISAAEFIQRVLRLIPPGPADQINPEIDVSSPEKECEARLMQAYLLHVQCGGMCSGRPKAFVKKAKDMAEFCERVAFSQFSETDQAGDQTD